MIEIEAGRVRGRRRDVVEILGADLVTYCGAYCGECLVRNGTIRKTATSLIGMLKGYGYHERAPAMAKRGVAGAARYSEAMEFLEYLTTEDCAGCKGGGLPLWCDDDCFVRACANEKQVAGCWECADEATCEKIAIIDSAVPQMRENRKRIRAVGVAAFAREQEAPSA
jgi:hypothetical protein